MHSAVKPSRDIDSWSKALVLELQLGRT